MSEKIRRIVADELKRSGLSVRAAAANAGITAATLSRYINGKQEIQTDTLEALLRVFGKELKAVRRQLRK